MANSIQSVVMVIDGQTVSLTSVDGITWSAEFQAPAGSSYNLTNGKYSAQFTATYETGGSTTLNGSGSSALEQQARLQVRETTKPTVRFSSPTADAYFTEASQNLEFDVLDDTVQSTGYSGINLSTLSVTLSSVSLSELITLGASDFTSTAITGGYRLTKTVQLDDATDWQMSVDVSDFDQNAAITSTVAFKIDTIAPSNIVTLPVNDFKTNNNVISVSGETDGTQLLVTVDGSDYGSMTIENGHYTGTVTLTTQGEHTIAFTAVDVAGNRTTISRTVTYSTATPQFVSVTFNPNPVQAGGICTVTVVMAPYAG